VAQQTTKHVLLVNQHGDNRGDEAALHAVLTGLEQRLPDVRFTVVHQFSNPASGPALRDDVTWIPHKMSVVEAVRLVVYLVFRVMRVRVTWLLGSVGRATINAYESADVVISAPGGPYFGDIYINHEFVHWLYVWMARLHRTPCALYATSAGPFEKKWANPFRRWTYRCFDELYVREQISANNIHELFGSQVIDVHVSVDAALQVSVPPLPREEQRLIVVSAINWTYKTSDDVVLRQRHYDRAIVSAITTLIDAQAARVVFVPQLHGTNHRDSPYLSSLATLTKQHLSSQIVDIEVWDENLDMLSQRSLFAAADFVIAGRYHPAVFAISGGVPQLCIPYEHKATGLLQLAGLSDLVLPIEEVTAEKLVKLAEYVLESREDIRIRTTAASKQLRELSAKTSDAVAELIGVAR
jgi:colanic acid/amylovoran biosynthesis protein